MAWPDYSYPPDPAKKEPGWKNITNECESLVKKRLAQAIDLFGPPTISSMPIRVTELKSAPRTDFYNGIAHIRVGVGVSGDERELEAQIAHEMVHALSRSAQNTMLEEGLCSYFAVNCGRAHRPHAEDPNEQKYYEAYAAVTELLKTCPTVIKELREPPRSIDTISAEEILKVCPDCSDELAKRVVSKF
jgi:hypothetical protein